ncbi:ubiquinone biosynthesis accessory factor UbiJ [Vibrio hippocampi]|uniref:Ubiquinone biosynthesis accessory factor UbiJ n=1 Tax=Vibrio hippocampi TaxID=654686 RepID=A0ABN8DD03_9VIBR|nr:SCP2 domain-containing protein [Vibrio hippocampi]CAH0524341.1 Ubiquinone biosynthesis accessory factor UbiJ [Vibrio hippocampi]
MPFEPLMTAVVETTLNTLIKEDDELVRRLSRLKGRVIQIHFRELNKCLTFVFSQQIDVLSQYEAEPDCYLSLNLSVLPQLRDQANITKLIKQDQLQLEGDIQLAQAFSALLSDCRPDPEEWLSKLLGDVAAHTMVRGAKSTFDFVSTQMDKHQRHLGQVVTEEWKLAPSPLEIAAFCDDVDVTRGHSEQLSQRIEKLQEQITLAELEQSRSVHDAE